MSPIVFLIGSIVLSAWLTLSFKLIERLGIDRLQSIVFNYIVCVITGSMVHGAFPINKQLTSEPWLPWALVMGCCFISLFNLAALVVQKIGVSVATVAYKLSMVIPFVFSLYLYNEEATALKYAGVVLALVAVWFTTKQPESTKKVNALLWLMPLILFVGSGLLDAMIKYVEQAFINDANQDVYLITAFATAATVGVVMLLVSRQRLQPKALLAGIGIGVPNYFSIWCLLRALKGYANNSSAIIPINNMGVVLFAAVMAGLLFHEKLTGLNRLGIALSIISIALIAFG